MSTELRTLVLNYLLADVQLRQLRADDAFAQALASVAADLRNLLAGKAAESPIDWGRAPEWARWAAMDDDGRWYWHECKPEHRHDYWASDGRVDDLRALDGRGTLQQRPK